MNKQSESRQAVARSIHYTISEISTRYETWAKEKHPNYRRDRDALNKTIEKAILEGDKPTKEKARETLNKLHRFFYRSTRAKFNYLIKSVCVKNGRNEAHIRRVANWPKLAERKTITVKSNI